MMTDHSHHYADVERVLYDGFEKIRKEVSEMKAEVQKNRNSRTACWQPVMRQLHWDINSQKKQTECSRQKKMILYGNSLSESVTQQEEFHVFRQRSFYEALTSVWFTRELVLAMEGSGFAGHGHYDRILYPY